LPPFCIVVITSAQLDSMMTLLHPTSPAKSSPLRSAIASAVEASSTYCSVQRPAAMQLPV
jgi:hypothetical protein